MLAPAVLVIGRGAPRRAPGGGGAGGGGAAAGPAPGGGGGGGGAPGGAERAGVLIAGPLGLCFLPAFLCLGIVPVVLGLAGRLLGGGLL